MCKSTISNWRKWFARLKTVDGTLQDIPREDRHVMLDRQALKEFVDANLYLKIPICVLRPDRFTKMEICGIDEELSTLRC